MRKPRGSILTKAEVVRRLTDEINTGAGKRIVAAAHCGIFLEALQEVVESALQGGRGVRLGFVTLEVKESPSRLRFHPATRKQYMTSPKKVTRAIIPAHLRKLGTPKPPETAGKEAPDA